MLDKIKSLFGKGKLRFEGTLSDGRTFSCIQNFIGDPTTLDLAEAKLRVGQQLLVEHGVKMTTCNYIGMSQEG